MFSVSTVIVHSDCGRGVLETLIVISFSPTLYALHMYVTTMCILIHIAYIKNVTVFSSIFQLSLHIIPMTARVPQPSVDSIPWISPILSLLSGE